MEMKMKGREGVEQGLESITLELRDHGLML